ncbi:hypothetical protein BGZ74_010711 [Mortierella antarctica]|nr:hypothetical protein BGZ74_010711 [Mortierella antarctica]
MLPSTRPLARTLVAASVRAASTRTAAGIAQARALHNKADPAIPGDATGFLPGDKITGETQIGSYPNLPMYNQQWRDATPSAGYWDLQDRRNFGETGAKTNVAVGSTQTTIIAPGGIQCGSRTGRGTNPTKLLYTLVKITTRPHAGKLEAVQFVPEEDDVLNIWSPDVWAFPASLGVKRMLAAAAAFLGFGSFLSETRPEPHFTRRNYPEDGLLKALGVDASDEVMVEKRGARA